MNWFLRVGAAVLLTFGLASSAFAATDGGQTAATAIQLPASLSASGSLAGISEGAFTFYTFSNPSNGTTGRITLNVTPTDSNTTNAVGVNLYQNGANLLTMTGLGLTSGSNSGTFSAATAGSILVQVYNYLPGSDATYKFTISGITSPETSVTSPVGAAPVTGTSGMTTATAVQLPASLSASGSLAGSSEGAFTFYTFSNPSNGTTGRITLNVTPTDSNTTNAVGVNLYQNGANLLTLNGLGPTPGSNSGTFSAATAGSILVQIYNYLPGSNVSYNFTITGITSPATSVTSPVVAAPVAEPPGMTAATAVLLPATMSATGTLAGRSSGAFTFYTFYYPGAGVVGRIALNIDPIDSNTTNAVGVNLYQAGANLLTLNGAGLTPGSNSGSFSSLTAGTILLQVYNYLPGQVVSYNFVVTGITR